MYPRQNLLVVIGASLLGITAAPASALIWKYQTTKIVAEPFQNTVEGIYPFQNNEEKSVALLGIETGCACLSAEADKSVYTPGESGFIKAVFALDARVGLHERKFTVQTDTSDTPVQLVLQVEVPAIAAVTPQSLYWKIDEAGIEKIIDVKPAGGLVITFTDVVATNESFSTRLETVTPGRHYRVVVIPHATDLPANAAIRIRGKESTGHPVEVSAYANVQ